MSESRICPVCEKEIPLGVRYSCQYCGFDLENLNDEEAIEKVRQSFTGKRVSPVGEEKSANTKILGRVGTSITVYIMIGLIIFFVVNIFAEFEIFWGSHEWAMLFFVIIVPGFLLVGLIAGVTYGIKFLLSRLRKK